MTFTDRALILARGVGSRMRAKDPDAQLTPEQERAADAGLKGLMPIHGRPFLDYVLASLAEAGLQSAGLVVGPDPDPVRMHYAEADTPLRVSFVVQERALGTADAVLAGETWAGGLPFLVMNADNLYPTPVLRALTALEEPGLPVFEREELIASSNIPPERVKAFALVEIDPGGNVTRILEKPSEAEIPGPDKVMLVSMNCWRFDTRIFQACRDVAPSARGELELPTAVMLAITRGVAFRGLPARGPVLDLSRRADAAEIARRLQGRRLRS